MALDLFAGIPVRDYATAAAWYGRLFGAPPAFHPHAKEAVWELAEHRYVYVVEQPERADSALVTLFVDDLDRRVGAITARAGSGARGDVSRGGPQDHLPGRGRQRVRPWRQGRVTACRRGPPGLVHVEAGRLARSSLPHPRPEHSVGFGQSVAGTGPASGGRCRRR